MTTPNKTIYPFAEMFEVDTDGTTAVEVWKIPAGTAITMVLMRIGVAGAGAGGSVIVGDNDDDNGFILAGLFCGGTVGTIFGDAITERGDYLNATGGAAATSTHAGKWKVYTDATKSIYIDCDTDMTTEATVQVFIFGYRYYS